MTNIADQFQQLMGVPLVLADPIASATKSPHEFVVTQYQISRATAAATGFRLSAADLLSNYGIDLALELVDYLSAPIIEGEREPLKRFEETAHERGVNLSEVVQDCLEPSLTDKLLSSNGQIPFRALDKVAQKLGIPLREIGRKNKEISTASNFRMKSLSQEARLTITAEQVRRISECIRISDDFWQLNSTFAAFTRPLRNYTLSSRELIEMRNWKEQYRTEWYAFGLLSGREGRCMVA
jgi:hypothetical protein